MNSNSIFDEITPTQFFLSQNYPNPFKEKTTIKFCIPYKTRVQLNVYDSDNKLIEKLFDGVKDPGTYEVKFIASVCHSGEARNLPDGYYYFRLKTPDYLSEKKWFCINSKYGRFNMKTFLKTLFFFLLAAQICFAQWVPLELGARWIRDIDAQNSNIFAVTYDSGIVYRSTDNGVSWTTVVDSNAIDVAISPSGKVFMIKDGEGWWGDSLFSSLDNGDTWIPLNIMEQIIDSIPAGGPQNVNVSPEGIVYCGINWPGCIGLLDAFAKSTDDGLTWTTPGGGVIGGHLFDFRGQFVITSGNLHCATTGGSYIYLSSDNGKTWDALMEWNGYFDISFVLGLFSNGNIVINAADGIYLSSDQCSTWTQIATLESQTSLAFSDGLTEGMLVGTGNIGVFLFSDEGDSLGSRNEGLYCTNVLKLSSDNIGNAYLSESPSIALWCGGIRRRPLSEIIVSVEKEPTQPKEFYLEQNFPNPFNPSTKIKYSVPQFTLATIKVFDILGNEIETLVNEEKPAGTYELTWYAEQLPSGVYFYQLKAGEYVNTKKMILLK